MFPKALHPKVSRKDAKFQKLLKYVSFEVGLKTTRIRNVLLYPSAQKMQKNRGCLLQPLLSLLFPLLLRPLGTASSQF